MFSVWTLAIVALAFPYFSSATGTSTVACIAAQWTYNQENFSPCQVASVLEAACISGTLVIDPLGTEPYYSGPSADKSNKCICSTVVYCLISACALCQEKNFTTWSAWSQYCIASDITIGQIPITIPPPISVPGWAYLNVTITDVWDPAKAHAAHDEAVRNKSSHAGAIAGGVVGGVIGFSLVAIGVFLLMRRRNTTTPVSNGGREKLDVAASPTRGFPSPAFPMQADWQRYYDLSNPGTFPNSSGPTLPVYVPATAAPDSVVAYYHPQGPQPLLPDTPPSGRYTGLPQI
ncbi:hypothetical protein BU17DRAFT_94770 [Hysterangium stoloniferum]|nr:hypothetical protein BU17DRAFT_94770 [Hysterangium stoloniferum]